jgi:hypothetical protein
MTTNRKATANRQNAQRSTGPRTSAGKARASRNSLRHGLAVPAAGQPALSDQIDAFARSFAGTSEISPALEIYARNAAEAHVDLLRARAARYNLLISWLDVQTSASAELSQKTKQLWGDPLLELTRISGIDVMRFLEGPHLPPGYAEKAIARLRAKLVRIERDFLSDSAGSSVQDRSMNLERQLRQIDRYERRALSRRKTALRSLTAAQAL